MDNSKPHDLNINYYAADKQGDSTLLVVAVIVVLIVVLLLILHETPNDSANMAVTKKSLVSQQSPKNIVWSGLGDTYDSVVTPMKKRTIPENDAPASLTVSSKLVDQDFGKYF